MQIRDKLLFVVTRLLRYISSIKLALIILVFTAVLLMVGVNPWYHFDAAFFSSWLFLLVLSVLFINLAFCTYNQTKRVFNKGSGVKTVLQGIGVGRVGIWGPVIFHMGLIIICFGIFLEMAFSFSGRIGLVPGQVFTDRPEKYLFSDYGLWRNNGESRFKLILHEIKPKYLDKGVYATGDISLIKDGEEVARQDVNAGHPLEQGIWSFYKDLSGYYVKIRIFRDGKEIPFDIGLSTVSNENSETYRDIFDNPEVPYKMNIEFIPDINMVKGKKSYKPDHPAIRLMVQNRSFQNGKVIFNDLVRIGQTVAIDKNTKIQFEGYFPWITLFFKIEPGVYIIYLGFGLCLGGLVFIYLLFPRCRKSSLI